MSEGARNPVRWGLVGFGAGGRVFHAPLLRATRGIALDIVVGSARHAADPARGTATVVPTLEAAADSGVEAVTITTPAGTHEDLAHRALDLGLHVVVDKPFALTAAGAHELIAHADEAGRLLSVYQNRRWDGDYITLVELVSRGEIGDVQRFYNRIQRFRPALPSWNTGSPAEKGGGTLLDLCPHLIDQSIGLLGDVVAVSAELVRHGGGIGAENDVLLSMRHASGARSVVEASVVAATQAHRFQANGTHGGIVIDGFDRQEADLFAGRSPLDAQWGVEPNDRVARIVTREDVAVAPLRPGRWNSYYPTMATAIRGQGGVPVNPRDAADTAAVIDAARLSATRREWVDVGG